jgi:hypothetical protein
VRGKVEVAYQKDGIDNITRRASRGGGVAIGGDNHDNVGECVVGDRGAETGEGRYEIGGEDGCEVRERGGFHEEFGGGAACVKRGCSD